ncbi:prepilin-type N-terminal cleavage/methylation domain-containing protein [Enterococcus sp. BWM-S5]|uniref:Prepilin-type N-terminal cleavage/methylation domain-containing protein n=1 Tax=Enterococcus larvae TaxID=2794352 RepID=A0ABS4CEK3_9ENTE|nr:prepilin-type N-terminal cleavage/methylation domain-containing protein [Enterococcus larvae]MBP1044803.1 prepilin-type N-terminal cleavage/methylation domain-containing protein [Enterococcus larvae]
MTEVLTLQEESRMSRLLKDERGMTLIELLATVVILAIISGIGLVAIGNVIQNSREDAAIADVQQAMNAAKLYQSSPSSAIGATFKLTDVIDDKFMESASANFDDADNIQFDVDADGTLTMTVPVGELKAGSKKNTVAITASNQAAVNALTRDSLAFAQ